MDLAHFDLNELLLAAMKSEMDSKQLYATMAKKTKNGLLEGKLLFLAHEEEKHRLFIEDIYKNHYPGTKIVIPNKSPVPLPEVTFTNDTPLSTLLGGAMSAEQIASTFYQSLADRFEKGSKIHNTLLYFADMEIGHYKLLEQDKESMERFEEADVYWPMVHAGP